jgi:hypothetical protein
MPQYGEMAAEKKELTLDELRSMGGRAWWNGLTEKQKAARIAKLTRARIRAAAKRRKQASAAA